MATISDAVGYQQRDQQEKLDPLYVAREALDQTGIAASNAFIFSDDAGSRHELDIIDQQRTLCLARLAALSLRFNNDVQFEKSKKACWRWRVNSTALANTGKQRTWIASAGFW